MDDLSDLLDGIDFPATKDEMIDAAVESDAPQELIERLQASGQEQYETRDEVAQELAEE